MSIFTRKVIFKNNDIVNKKRAQLISAIDTLCNENKLEYFAIGDLLVGAVHYNDFIDNGLDSKTEIGLLRNDYEKLTKLLYTNRDKFGYDIIDRYKSGAKTLSISISLPVTIEQNDLTLEDIATVDIRAFDYVPKDLAERKMYLRKAENAVSKYEKSANLLPPVTQTPMNLRKVVLLFKDSLLYGQKSPAKFHKKLNKILNKYQNTEYVANIHSEKSMCIALDDVFPTTRIAFSGIEINIPKNCNNWTVKIDDELMKRTKTIQKLDLVLLKEFDRVCRKIGVSYFICGGTLLGYKRHGGFIPWDDDIDVGMLRADYDKFLKEGKKHLGEDFFLQTRKSDRKIPYLFSKIRLNGTEYITKYNELRDFHKGICLDLFPFDYVPNSLSERKRFVEKALFWSNVHFETVNRQIEKPDYKNRSKTFYGWWACVDCEIRRRLIRMIPLRLTEYMYLKKATKFNSSAEKLNLKTVASFLPSYTYADVDDIKPYQDITFEGITVMTQKDGEKFLKMQYGDYKELPLLHKRVGHDLIRWSVSDEIAEKYNIYED